MNIYMNIYPTHTQRTVTCFTRVGRFRVSGERVPYREAETTRVGLIYNKLEENNIGGLIYIEYDDGNF